MLVNVNVMTSEDAAGGSEKMRIERSRAEKVEKSFSLDTVGFHSFQCV